MHGLTLEVVGWEYHLHFPYLEGCTYMAMDKDSITGQYMTSIYTGKGYYMAAHNNTYDIWILYQLKYITYNELEDIRKAYIHGNRYHP